MSHYADYIKERLGKLCFECEDGFAVYFYTTLQGSGECVYIEEIYVAPHARRKGVAAWMANQIAEEAQGRGVRTMVGSVNPQARGATASLTVLLGYGMTLHSVDNGLIYFSKSLED